jgi:hypothetical protein
MQLISRLYKQLRRSCEMAILRNFRTADHPELSVSVSLTIATSVDDVTDQLLGGCVSWESQEKAPSQIILDPDAHRHAAPQQAGMALLSLLRPRLLLAADIVYGDHLLWARLHSSNIYASAVSPEEM